MDTGGNTALDPFRSPAINCSGRGPSRSGTGHHPRCGGFHVHSRPQTSWPEARPTWSNSYAANTGRFHQAAGNLQVKEVVVGDGERRQRFVVCFNPEAAASVDDYLLNVARKRRKGELVV